MGIAKRGISRTRRGLAVVTVAVHERGAAAVAAREVDDEAWDAERSMEGGKGRICRA